MYESDLPDPGSDRLEGGEVAESFPGGGATWRLPTGYELVVPGDPTEFVLSDGSLNYRITVDGDDATREAFDAFLDETITTVESNGGEASTVEVTMAGRDYVVLLQDLPDAGESARTFFLHAGDSMTYSLTLSAPQAMADVPPDRVEEFHQVVASLEPVG